MAAESLLRLEQQLRDPALNQRKAALDELATYPAEVAVPVLQRLAAEKDFLLRRLAVMGLGNHRVESSFQTLQGLLETEPDANVLAEVANSVFEFGEAAIPVLHQLFGRCDHWLVRHGIISLLVETQDFATLLLVIRAALQDENYAVKEAGILALHRLFNTPLQAEAIALLTQLAEDEDWRIRWRTAIALKGCSDPQAKSLLLQLQRDEHHRVVAAALDAIH